MFYSEILSSSKSIVRVRLLLEQSSPILLGFVIATAVFQNYLLIRFTNGGSDLLEADIPKSLMLLHGQNPYASNPWAAPYPPLLLTVLAGLLLAFNNLGQPTLPVDVLSQQIRLAGLFAIAGTSMVIYLTLRRRGSSAFTALVPAALFATLPAIGTSQVYFFHSDTFGYTILALSLLGYVLKHYTTGTILLSLSIIFKIHPILALPLVLVWLVRKKGIRPAVPSILAASTILFLGLLFPLELPGYQQAVLGYNLSDTGTPTDNFLIPNLLYGIVPGTGITIPLTLGNEIWIAATAAFFTITIGAVWTRARDIGPVNVIALGLLAWLIPTRRLLPHYMLWGLIPLITRRNMPQSIVLAGLFQASDMVTSWVSLPGLSPIPGLGVGFGWFLSSLVYRFMGIVAIVMILRTRTIVTLSLPTLPPASPEQYLAPITI